MKILRIIANILVPVVFALLLPYIALAPQFPDYGNIYAIVAMVVMPFTAGFVSILLSGSAVADKKYNQFFFPWLSIILFFILAFILNLQDCGCWLVGLPFFLMIAGLGGMVAGYFKKRSSVKNQSTVTIKDLS